MADDPWASFTPQAASSASSAAADPWAAFSPGAAASKQPEESTAGALWRNIKSVPLGMREGFAGAASALGQSEAGLQAGATGDAGDAGLAQQVPGAAESDKLLEQHVTGELPGDGKYGRSVGRVLGNPGTYLGPGGVLLKIGAGVATGLGAEGGKELLPNHPIVGELAGGVLGGGLFGAAAATTQNIMRARAIPTTAELRRSADQAYDQARALNPRYQPQSVQNLQADIRDTLLRGGHRPDLSSGTFSRIDELTHPYRGPGLRGQQPSLPNFSDIEGVRQTLNMVRKEVHPTTGGATADSRAAGVAIEKIDDFLADHSNAIPRDQPIARRAAELAEEGRGNWAAMSRSQTVEQALQSGELRAGSTGSGGNIDNVLRQQIRSILANPRRVRGFTADERGIMNDIVMGNPVRNSARLVGKMAATGIVSLGGAEYLASLMGLGPVGHVALPIAGYAAKKAGDIGTRNRIGRLTQAIRADSPLGQTRNIPARASAAPYVARSLVTNPYGQ